MFVPTPVNFPNQWFLAERNNSLVHPHPISGRIPVCAPRSPTTDRAISTKVAPVAFFAPYNSFSIPPASFSASLEAFSVTPSLFSSSPAALSSARATFSAAWAPFSVPPFCPLQLRHRFLYQGTRFPHLRHCFAHFTTFLPN